jgi:hypothetical protein
MDIMSQSTVSSSYQGPQLRQPIFALALALFLRPWLQRVSLQLMVLSILIADIHALQKN